MTTLVYFAAASLDGFIAGPKGDLDWLHAFEGRDEDHGFAEFFGGVDGLVMGRKTYEVCRGFGAWPYGDRPCWVLSKHAPGYFGELPSGVQVTYQSPGVVAARWQTMGLKRVWLVGGGELAGQFAEAGLIDELIIASVPVLLGDGRRLFGRASFERQHYALESTRRFETGIVSHHWRRAPQQPAVVPVATG